MSFWEVLLVHGQALLEASDALLLAWLGLAVVPCTPAEALGADARALQALTTLGLRNWVWLVARQAEHLAYAWIVADVRWLNRPEICSKSNDDSVD